jgi:peptide/nickel transport system permease protein
MAHYLIRRLFQFIPVVFLVTAVVFAITMLLPGDAALSFLGEANIRDQVAYEAMRKELGLDEPLPVQYGMWLGRALRGDFGRSIRTREPVLEALAARIPVTLRLAGMAIIISVVIAIPVGILSATRPNSIADRIGTVGAMIGIAVPNFWLGIILIYVFAVWLRLLPPSGYAPPASGLWPNLRSLLLPALALGMAQSVVVMRQTRSSLIEVLRQDYITVARAKGVGERRVIRRHALKNALIPVVTVFGLQLSHMIGGAVIIETIFALPGMGRVMADSIFFRDFPMLQGVVLLTALSVLIANFLTDVAYAYLDPRIRYG